MARRLNEKGGPIDKPAEGGAALAAGVETFSAATLAQRLRNTSNQLVKLLSKKAADYPGK